MSRLFSIYSHVTSVMILPVSLVVIALLIILKDDISDHWYSITMALLYIDLGYVISLLLFRVVRQGEKDSFPESKDDLESEIQKATKEEVVKSKTGAQKNVSVSQNTAEKINLDKKPSVSILDLHTAFIGSEDRLRKN